jgi:High potential iron-sulfur protein
MNFSRREFAVSLIGLVSFAALPRITYGATDMLSEADPSAIALGYRTDATTVDKTKYSKYASGQTCANCQFYQGGASDHAAPCPLFNGRQVAGTGWCNGYAQKG